MRPLKPEQWLALAAGLLAVAYGGYLLAGRSRRNGDLTAPQYQPPPEGVEARARAGLFNYPDGHTVVCAPGEHLGPVVYTTHRYPVSTAGNLTSAIHHGWSSMRVPHVDDVQWIISPPSEVAW